MENPTTLTFGGSGLDRAHDLRNSPDQIAAFVARGAVDVVLFWRGKPLVTGAARDRLVRLPVDHKILLAASPVTIFLGREGDRIVVARDLAGWEPETLDMSTLGTFLDPSEQNHPDLPNDMVFAELRSVMVRLDPRDAELAATAKAVIGWHDSHGFCARCGGASVIAQNGWRRDCPACNAQHFPRTDPVVIMLITHGNVTLLGRSPGWPEGMYSCLAGFIEPGETIEAAVRREVFEEAGVQVGEVRYLASQPWPFPASLMMGCVGQALGRDIVVDPTELEDAFWISREDLAAAFRDENPKVKPARKGSIARYLLENWLADRLD